MSDNILGIQATINGADIRKQADDFVKSIDKIEAAADSLVAKTAKRIGLADSLKTDNALIEKAVEEIINALEQLKADYAALPSELKKSDLGNVISQQIEEGTQHVRNMNKELNSAEVANATRNYNGLNVQMQMLAREVPNLAFGFQTFAMAISNNLPMLADELSRVTKEVDALKKAGQSYTPVWKQVLSSFFNWQTALIGGITILTMYGAEIGEWIKNMTSANDKIKDAAKLQKDVAMILKEGSGEYGKQLVTLKKLQSTWQSLGSDLEKQKQFILDNQDAFNKLGVGITSVSDAENLFVKNTSVFVEALKLRTKAEAGRALAQKEYEKALAKQVEADTMPEQIKQWQAIVQSTSGAVQGQFVMVDNAKKKQLQEEAANINKLADSYFAMADAEETAALAKLKLIGLDEPHNLEGNSDEIEDNSKAYKQANEAVLKAQELQIKAQKSKTAAMKEGFAKNLQEMKDAHAAELAQLEDERQQYLNFIIETERMKFEASENEKQKNDAKYKKKAFDASRISLSDEEESRFGEIKTNTITKQQNEIAAFYADIMRLQAEATIRNKNSLQTQLSDLDIYYQKAIEKAEGFAELQKQLEEKRLYERNLLLLNGQLSDNSLNTDYALAKSENKYESTGLVEMAEREKLEILKKYGEERISILQQIGDEQSEAEIKSLQIAIEGYDKQLKKPKTIKQVFDEKIFSAVEKHFAKTAKSADEAEKKTLNFFKGFSGAGVVATDVVNSMLGLFGGISEELDAALNAVSSIAVGFAEGGLAGGISAAAGQAISAVGKLLKAKKEVDASMIEGYKAYSEAIDRLIEKQLESIEVLGGSDFTKTIQKSYIDMQKQLQASRKLFAETMKSGSGVFSHSVGYKANEMLKEQAASLRQAGIYQTDLSRMTNEQLVSLMEIPEVWARLDDKLREYISDMADAYEQVDELNTQLQDMLLGFSADNITTAIVDALTSNEIDSAMNDLSSKLDEYISQIVQNIIVKMALTEPITKAVQDLMKGIANYNTDGTIKSFKNVDEIEAGVLAKFKETVLSIGKGFSSTWLDLVEDFKSVGIDLNNVESDSYSQQASGKGFQTISQDTANVLEGRFTALQIAGEEIKKQSEQQTILQTLISTDTAAIRQEMSINKQYISEIVDIQYESVGLLASIDKNTRPISQIRDDIRSMKDDIHNRL